MTWEVLPSCYDIDTFEDLRRLVLDMQAVRGERPVACPRTRKALEALSHVVTGDNRARKSR